MRPKLKDLNCSFRCASVCVSLSPCLPSSAYVSFLQLTRGTPTHGPAPAPDPSSPGTLHARLSFSRPAWQQSPTLTVSRQRSYIGPHSSPGQSITSQHSHYGRGSSKSGKQECGGASEGRDSCCVKCSGTGKAPSGCACDCALGCFAVPCCRSGYTDSKAPTLGHPLPQRKDSRLLFGKQANSTSSCPAASTEKDKSSCSKCGLTNPPGSECDCTPHCVSTGVMAGTPWAPNHGTRSGAVLFGRPTRDPEIHCASLLTVDSLEGAPTTGGASGVPEACSHVRRDNKVLFARTAREPECHHRSFLVEGSLVGVTKTGGVPRRDSRQFFGRPCSDAAVLLNSKAEAQAAISGAALLQRAKEGGAPYSDRSTASHSATHSDEALGAVRSTETSAAPETAWSGSRRDSRALFSCVPPPQSNVTPAVLPAGENHRSSGSPRAVSHARLSSLISSWSSSGGTPPTGVPVGDIPGGLGVTVQDSNHHVTMVVPLPPDTTARGLQVEIVAGR